MENESLENEKMKNKSLENESMVIEGRLRRQSEGAVCQGKKRNASDLPRRGISELRHR